MWVCPAQILPRWISDMSGHSKWSQIKHKKGAADAKKGIVFGKLARAITIAARGNPDPLQNLRLKAEIERARAANMPSDSIERAIRRVSEKESSSLEEILLQCIGPGGAAILIEAVTDNANRTILELKTLTTRLGGRMVGQGTLSWMFRRQGRDWTALSPVPVTDDATRQQLEQLLEALDEHDDVQHISTNIQW